MPLPAFFKNNKKCNLKRATNNDNSGINQSPSFFKIIFPFLFFVFLYFILPLILIVAFCQHPFIISALYILAVVVVISLFLRRYIDKKYNLVYRTQVIQEKLNVVLHEDSLEIKNNLALNEKISRYNRLKEVAEVINQSLELDTVGQKLADIASSLIANNKGVCLLYLVDPHTQKPTLFKTKKEKDFIVKEKEGDVFDFWVLRHSNPLLIEDIKKDFRFDLEKLVLHSEGRVVSSLISSPFVSENRLLGLMRLDNPKPNAYSQDDLRLLSTICDLGAVALENGEFYQQTEQLAMHDGLTLLFTKGYLIEHLKEKCKKGLRQNIAFSLLMLDVDYFKNYNDLYGHSAGDIVLKKISQKIVDSLKNYNPEVSRFGGEEFCVILPDTEKDKALEIATKLCEEIRDEKIVLRRQETHISVSIGVASFPSDASDEDGLIKKADCAMYEAKQNGRNRVVSA
ncbi:MAG: sensor domain-containing diguanylate cyclase [Candidatus Omnitrophica bacterium]|nr:sensor domain-containing diguanylate cyclase [Candidatus Omnitrophota bacterium]